VLRVETDDGTRRREGAIADSVMNVEDMLLKLIMTEEAQVEGNAQ
jgi:hypothetical protein